MLLDDHKIKVYPEQVILSYIQRYISDDYEYKTNEEGHWINVPSPFYPDRRRRLGFNLDSGIIFDFKLQKGWDMEHFIIKHSKEVLNNDIFSVQKASELLFRIRMDLKKHGTQIINPVRKVFEEEGAIHLPELEKEEIPVGIESFMKERIFRDKMGRKAIIYLQKRSFTPEIIKQFNLQHIS